MKTTCRFLENVDRYAFDFGACSTKKGFAQVDTGQDAWYFGMWANPNTFRIVTYAEGDMTLRECDSPEEFVTTIRSIIQSMDDLGHGFKGIDPGLAEENIASWRRIGLADLLH